MNYRKDWGEDDGGQALLEFALVLPLLLFLLFAIFTVGYWMNAQQLATQAAAQGARQGALTNSNAQISGAVAATMRAIDPNIADSARARTSISISPASEGDSRRVRGNPLEVLVIYRMPFLFGSLPAGLQTVRGTATSYMECVPTSGFICAP